MNCISNRREVNVSTLTKGLQQHLIKKTIYYFTGGNIKLFPPVRRETLLVVLYL